MLHQSNYVKDEPLNVRRVPVFLIYISLREKKETEHFLWINKNVLFYNYRQSEKELPDAICNLTM